MVVYQCPRCSYEVDRLSSIKKHLTAKKLCKIVLKDVVPTEDNIIIKEDKYSCNICKKEFNNKDYLGKHKCSIDMNNIVVQLLNEITYLKNDMSSRLTSLENTMVSQNNVINNNNNNNITNNSSNINLFVLKDFKNTKIDHITAPMVVDYLKRCMRAIPMVIQDIHYNPDIPENHNAYITNKKTKDAQYLVDGKWKSMNGEELAEKMMTDYHYKFFHTMSENLKIVEEYPDIKDRYDNYMKVTDGNNKIICKDIIELMYNNREMCIETRKRLKN